MTERSSILELNLRITLTLYVAASLRRKRKGAWACVSLVAGDIAKVGELTFLSGRASKLEKILAILVMIGRSLSFTCS